MLRPHEGETSFDVFNKNIRTYKKQMSSHQFKFVGGQPHKHGVASSKVIQTRACKAPGDSSRRRQLRLIGASMIRLRNQ